jgi:hypothetical protein
MQLAVIFFAGVGPNATENWKGPGSEPFGPVAQRLEQGTHKRKPASIAEPHFLRKTSGKQGQNGVSASAQE